MQSPEDMSVNAQSISANGAQGNLGILPIGLQFFPELVEEGYVYVDKTEHVYRMTHLGSKYVFLSRPRRFGKTLLCSTMEAYFQGRKDLFGGTAMATLERDWEAHEVLMLSMNRCKGPSAEVVGMEIANMLASLERRYGIQKDASVTLGGRLSNIIEAAYERSGKRVVVIIDEYDAPLLDVLHDEAALREVRSAMKSFYEVLKPADRYLRFVFMTGVTKFAQLSLFSAFNNINNISMDVEFADICGITPEEIERQLLPHVDRLALSLGTDRDGALAELKRLYDGYHFTLPSPDIYNPFSLVCALSKRQLKSFWFGTGTPTFLIEMMRKFGTDPTTLSSVRAKEADFDQSTDTLETIVPLMYQSGYLTIKSYDADRGQYSLGIPNREVHDGLMESLARLYVGNALSDVHDTLADIRLSLKRNDMDGALRLIRDFLKTVPYANVKNQEGHYQQMLYIIFSLLGAYVDLEVRTAKGRIDVVMSTQRRLFLLELKLDKSADAAMGQIDLMDDPARFANAGLPVTKVGVNFSTEERTITDWVIE